MIVLLLKINFLLSTHINLLCLETVLDGLKLSDGHPTGLTIIMYFFIYGGSYETVN